MTDKRTIQLIVGTLALTIIGSLAASVGLSVADKPIPELIDDLTKFATGAISAFLVRTSVDPGQLQAEKPNVQEDGPEAVRNGPFNHEVN